MTSTDTITIQEFVKTFVITSSAVKAKCNPNCADWEKATHWHVSIWRMGVDLPLVVPFSQGLAHKEPPTVCDVLGCLAADARTYEEADGDFGQWAEDMSGGDEKPPSLWRTFNAIGRQTVALEKLLGVALYQKLLHHVEGL
jgi:hypothetical protein